MEDFYEHIMKRYSDPEKWDWIPGFEGKYEASNYGRIRSYCSKKTEGAILMPKITPAGYWFTHLGTGLKKPRTKSVGIGRLVATVFVPNPDDLPEVDYIDNDKSNLHWSNLQWIQHDDNCRKDQAYTYKVWNIKDPEKVIILDSKRQVEAKVGKSYGWLAYRLGIPGVPSRDGWMCEVQRLKGSEKRRW